MRRDARLLGWRLRGDEGEMKWTVVGPASAVLEYDDAIAELAGRMASSYMLERGVEGGG